MLLLDYVDAHQAESWVFIGFALLALKALILSFTSGILLFGAIGALITGILILIKGNFARS